MRLTLRTLLAYLDDVLEPSETKLIGQKIQESAVAGKLIDLIRLVVRQRRLKAPSVTGPNIGIDPNVVAQYLDNTLPPEQVVEVEKVLLTSDELLAEVASCHQVLALVMGKPGDVSEASRERLYALGPVAKSDQLQVDESVPMNGSPASSSRDSERAVEPVRAKPQATEIPEYLRQSSWSQRVFPAAIVVVLVAACACLLIADPQFLTGLSTAKRELANDRETGKVVPGKNGEAEPKKEIAKTGQAQTPTTPTVVDPAAVAMTQKSELPTSLDPLPPADVPEPALPAANPKKPPTPDGDVPADAAVAAVGIPPAPADLVPLPNGKEPPAVLSPVPVQYISNEGVVFRFDEQVRHWLLLPRRSVVAGGEMLVVPEPFEAVLDFDRGSILATVLGDSTVRVMSPDRISSSGLDVHRGKIQFRYSRKDPQKTSQLAIVVGNDVWRLEFLPAENADTVCTIEVAPREPFQFEKPFDQNWYLGVLRVLSGSVKWTPADGKSQLVPNQTALEIIPQQAGSIRPSPVSSGFAPEWTDPQKRKQAPLRRFASLFEKQFKNDEQIEQSLLALVKDSNAKISELAVRALALTDSYAGLAQALAECGFEEGRFAARDGIRTWLGRQADRGAILKGVLEARYPAGDANTVYILLWGFRPEDATNQVTSIELVNWLRSNHVEIRELAYYWIAHLTNRKWEYRATADLPRREAAIRRIEAHIMKDGALVKKSDKDPLKTE